MPKKKEKQAASKASKEASNLRSNAERLVFDAKALVRVAPWLRRVQFLSPDIAPRLPEVADRMVALQADEFTWSSDFSPSWVATLMRHGFLTMATEAASNQAVLLPKLHEERCVVTFDDLKIQHGTRKRAKKCKVTVNGAFDEVVVGLREQHGASCWFYPPLVASLKLLATNPGAFDGGDDDGGGGDGTSSHASSSGIAPVRVHTFEVWQKKEEGEGDGGWELAAGEMGYSVGKMYTSLSGFSRRSGCGSVQLAATASLLQRQGCVLWDLGMSMDYKLKMGGRQMPRRDFVAMLTAVRKQSSNRNSNGGSGGGGSDLSFLEFHADLLPTPQTPSPKMSSSSSSSSSPSSLSSSSSTAMAADAALTPTGGAGMPADTATTPTVTPMSAVTATAHGKASSPLHFCELQGQDASQVIKTITFSCGASTTTSTTSTSPRDTREPLDGSSSDGAHGGGGGGGGVGGVMDVSESDDGKRQEGLQKTHHLKGKKSGLKKAKVAEDRNKAKTGFDFFCAEQQREKSKEKSVVGPEEIGGSAAAKEEGEEASVAVTPPLPYPIRCQLGAKWRTLDTATKAPYFKEAAAAAAVVAASEAEAAAAAAAAAVAEEAEPDATYSQQQQQQQQQTKTKHPPPPPIDAATTSKPTITVASWQRLVGFRVQLVGLVARPDLNGKTGLVVGPATTTAKTATNAAVEDQRACVVVDGGLGTFNLKTQNLAGMSCR